MFIPYAFNLRTSAERAVFAPLLYSCRITLKIFHKIQMASMSAVSFGFLPLRLFVWLSCWHRQTRTVCLLQISGVILLFQAGIKVFLYAAVCANFHSHWCTSQAPELKLWGGALILPMVSVSVSRVFRVSLIANSRLWVRCFCGGGFSIVLRYLLNLVYTSY